MAKITIEELSGSLKEYLNGLGLTEAQVQELIDKFEDEKIGDISQLSTEEKGSLVGAINELFQSANNGKELIASAIGEPLDSNDTFSAMSVDINNLLSTFKTNMMNNGITVESSDRFKSLIDKIATMVEEGSGKGIQFASGEGTLSLRSGSGSASINGLPFTPTYIFCFFSYAFGNTSVGYFLQNGIASNIGTLKYKTSASGNGSTGANGITLTVSIVDKGFTISKLSTSALQGDANFTYYAIGVGEEDTTLRDSLASILEEEGVSVTEEDDIASLITKVDDEFSKDNNTINELNGQIINKDNIISGLNSQINELNNTISNSKKWSNGSYNNKIESTTYETTAVVVDIPLNLDFTPSMIIIFCPLIQAGSYYAQNVCISNLSPDGFCYYAPSKAFDIKISNISRNSFTLSIGKWSGCTIYEFTWYAFE